MRKNIIPLIVVIALVLLVAACTHQDTGINKSEADKAVENADSEAKGERIVEKNEEESNVSTEVGDGSDTAIAQVEEDSFAYFETIDLEGNTVNQDIIAQADLTVLNIWGTFCGPCIHEMPFLGEIAQEYQDKGVQVIGVVIDVYDESMIDKAKEIVKTTEANYLHLLPTQDLSDIYLSKVSSIPETLFIDKDGNIIESVIGAKSKEDWISIIDEKLSQLE